MFSFIFLNKVWQIVNNVTTLIMTAEILQQMLIYIQILSKDSREELDLNDCAYINA